MNDKISVRKALRVFQKIREEGTYHDGRYQLSGLCAETGFDGYTASICNDYVRLDIFFHNKFSFQFSNKKEKALFLEKLSLLDKAS